MSPVLHSARPADVQMLLPPRSASVGDARHAVGGYCRSSQLAAVADDAELLTSELMSNACRHSDGDIELTATTHDGELHVRVTDSATGAPSMPPKAPTMDSDGGRGLFIVDQIAHHWGVELHAAGNTVWFVLP